jgi:ribosome biogenesis SPOUT family RNA methylase Rps3
MPYCSSILVILPDVDMHQTLSLVAQQQFNALAAHELGHNEFNIDAALNDVRAIVSQEEHEIRFCCRYESDVQRINRKVVDFAKNHSNFCTLGTA